jgi:hypothetical protein
MKNCKICDSELSHVFDHKVMGKYDSSYYNCPKCGYMTMANPHWLEEAYSDSITSADIGLLSRNIQLSHKVAVLTGRYLDVQGNYLDYAGGYGVFTRLMRDAGFSFYHDDPYTVNLFAKDFEYRDFDGTISAVTCFECLEHFVDPLVELEKVFQISKNAFFTTRLKPMGVPDLDWDYYAFDHGQHVSFYTEKALQAIARRFGLHVVSAGNLHFFSEMPTSSNGFRYFARRADKRPHVFAKRTRFESLIRKIKKSHANKWK